MAQEALASAGWTDSADLYPTEDELRISARLLLHIARFPRFVPHELVPTDALSQAGIAAALGTSQSAVSNVLRRLVYGGVLRVERVHVPRRPRRVKVYQLTAEGEALVGTIRRRLRDLGSRTAPSTSVDALTRSSPRKGPANRR